MTDTTTRRRGRRDFLRRGMLGGAAALAAPAIATAQGQTTVWRVNTAMPGGAGLEAFNAWCASIVEKSGGELAFEPSDPSNGFGGFELYEALRRGEREAVNPFTIYAQSFTAAGPFLSSYPMAMRAPHEFDTFYYGLGGLELAREIYAAQGFFFVGPIHHGPNIIHSRRPINRVDDFRGLKMRAPGGMVSALFEQLGAEVISLPGEEIFGALESGRIDAADYVGPAVNYALGFSKETNFISMGPPGYMSVYQPVDLMDLTVRMDAWEALSPEMKYFLETEVQAYSNAHHAAIQAADQEAWARFEADGTRVVRLSPEDVRVMTKVAVPIWFDFANRDRDAARVFKVQLDYMTSGSLGYVDKAVADLFELDL
jgi:TRAP-type mannitol/chloroaromatic compound transport system substrate-binding protein